MDTETMTKSELKTDIPVLNISFISEDLQNALKIGLNEIQANLDNITDENTEPSSVTVCDINEIIISTLHLIEEIENEKAEILAEHFIHWSTENGISFNKLPFTLSQQNPNLYLKDLRNDDKEDGTVWRTLSFIFSNIWCKRLITLSSGPVNLSTSYQILQIVHNLLLLYEENDIWNLYKDIRHKSFLNLCQNNKLKTSDFTVLMQTVKKMMQLDLKIVNECFSSDFLSFANLQQIYLDDLSNQILAFMENESFSFKTHRFDDLLKIKIETNWNNESGKYLSHYLCKYIENITSDIDEILQLLINCWKLEVFANNITRSVFEDSEISEDVVEGINENKAYEINEELKNEVWEWRKIFAPFMFELGHFIDTALQTITLTLLNEEWDHFTTLQQIQSYYMCKTLTSYNSSNSKVISPFIFAIVNTINSFVPAFKICDNSLSDNFQTLFISSVNQSVSKVISHFLKLSQVILSKKLMKSLYLLISTSTYLKSNVEYYVEIFKDKSEGSLQSSCDKLNELISGLMEHGCNYLISLMQTTILHNKDCHNWNSNKAFFENERISFSIQMWNVFMQALKHDLWITLSSSHAQEMFFSVFKSTLTFLAFRYSSIRPSFAHVEHMRSDITAILVSSAKFLLAICNHSYADSVILEERYNWVHSICSTLFATLVIVTSPLRELSQKVQENFFPISSETSNLCDDNHYNTSLWLHIFHPELWPSESQYSFPQISNLYKQLELIDVLPSVTFPTIIQALLIHKCFLSIELILHSNDIENIERTTSFDEILSSTFCTVEKQHCQCNLISFTSVAEVVISILSSCYSYPQALGNVLLAIIQRENSWELFWKPVDKIPQWFHCILNLMEDFLSGTVQAIIQKIYMTFILYDSEIISTISPSIYKTFQDSRSIDSLVESFKDELVLLLHCLPIPLKYFFAVLDVHLPHKYKSHIWCGSIAAQIMILYLDSLFTSNRRIERFLQCSLAEQQYLKIKSVFEEFMDLLKHTLSQEILKWTELKSTNGEIKEMETTIIDEKDEALWKNLSSEIANTEKGATCLIKIHELFKLEKNWVRVLIGCKFSAKEFNHCLCKPSFHSNTCIIFNPFANSGFGLKDLDQHSIIGYQYDWLFLFDMDLGIIKSSLSQLLCNRWEMEDDEGLDENEKEMVARLKKLCNINSTT